MADLFISYARGDRNRVAALASEPRIRELRFFIQRRQGDMEGQIETFRQVRALDPQESRWTMSLVKYLMYSRRYDEAGVEIANAEFQSHELAYWKAVLDLKARRNIGRWADEIIALQQEFEGTAAPAYL